MIKGKVSIIITAYNAETYIDQLFNNVNRQTFKEYKIVFVDNGSTDNTYSLVQEYQKKDKKIILLRVETNVGVGDGRNIGLKWAIEDCESEYVLFLDVDDWLHPQCLEIMTEIIYSDSSDMVFERHALSSQYSDEFNCFKAYSHQLFEDMESFWCDTMDTLAFITGRLVRKDLFKNIVFPPSGLDDERTTYRLVYKANKVSLIDESLYYWYQNPNSYMHKYWDPWKLQDLIESVRDPLDFFYEHRYEKSFNVYIRRYYGLLVSKLMEYEGKRNYKKVFRDQYEYIRNMEERFVEYKAIDFKKEYINKLSCTYSDVFRNLQLRSESILKRRGAFVAQVFFSIKIIPLINKWRITNMNIKKYLY